MTDQPAFSIPRTPFAGLVVQKEVASALAAALGRRRLGHAYLFAGPRGIGKEAVAYALGLAALCPRRPGVGCGECNTCRRVIADLHPDFRRYEVAGAHFDVDTVRDLQAEAFRPPSEGRRKVLLVIEPEKMTYRNDVSANALLKTLEEPPGSATFVLLAHDPRSLLPTVVSRCIRVNFPRLKASEIEGVLRAAGVEAEEAAAAALAADGSLEGASRFLSEEYNRTVAEALNLWQKVQAGGITAAFAAAAVTRDRDEALKLVRVLGDVVRRTAATRLGEEAADPREAERYRALASSSLTPEEAWEALARAGEALHNNANVALTLEELFLALVPGS